MMRFARSAGAWLRLCLLLPPAVPRRLVAALAVWPVLLFAFFVIPQEGYVNVPPLFAVSTPSSGDGGPTARPNQAAARRLAVLVLPIDQDDDTVRIARVHNEALIRERIGTNILVSAGYLSDAHYVPDAVGYPPRPYFVLQPHYGPSGCASAHAVPLTGPLANPETERRAPNLALAIVAVEKFNRNTLHRQAERLYADLYRWTFGYLPDLSFGPAQIRLSLLRQVAAQRPDWPTAAAWSSLSDDQLLDKVWRECEALKIAATLVLHQLALSSKPDCSDRGDCVTPEEIVASTYSGERRRRLRAPIDYVGIVQAMVRMMENTLPDEPK